MRLAVVEEQIQAVMQMPILDQAAQEEEIVAGAAVPVFAIETTMVSPATTELIVTDGFVAAVNPEDAVAS
jgi:hypothetical protein